MIDGFFRLVEDIALRERIDPLWLANGKRTTPPILGRLRDELIAEAMWRRFDVDDVMACLELTDFWLFAGAAQRGAAALGREAQADAWRRRILCARRAAKRRKEAA